MCYIPKSDVCFEKYSFSLSLQFQLLFFILIFQYCTNNREKSCINTSDKSMTSYNIYKYNSQDPFLTLINILFSKIYEKNPFLFSIFSNHYKIQHQNDFLHGFFAPRSFYMFMISGLAVQTGNGLRNNREKRALSKRVVSNWLNLFLRKSWFFLSILIQKEDKFTFILLTKKFFRRKFFLFPGKNVTFYIRVANPMCSKFLKSILRFRKKMYKEKFHIFSDYDIY